jgi:hypothetical protein
MCVAMTRAERYFFVTKPSAFFSDSTACSPPPADSWSWNPRRGPSWSALTITRAVRDRHHKVESSLSYASQPHP